jgi:transcriptional regulator with XRE-family HTH domain
MELYEKIRFMRSFKNWSQEEMANRLGLSVNGYAKIERGETDVTLSRLQQIVDVLGVDLAELFDLNEKNVFHFAGRYYYAHHHQINYLADVSVTKSVELKHELEKSHLIIQQQEKEICYLKEEIVQLKEIIDLVKRQVSA